MSENRERIYFISDVHLGAPSLADNERAREDALIAFLRHIRSDAAALYIVGDLFDFWFEYRSAVPDTGARVLFELYNTVQAGVRVVYLPGNHDLWPGCYLRDQVGLELPGPSVSLEAQGKRLYITHGDDFRKDFRFRLSRGILKNRFCIALFRLLHPDVGAWIARRVSRISESRPPNLTRNHETYRRGARRLVGQGFDYTIIGHYHLGRIQPIGAGHLVILDDWNGRGSYALLEGGTLTLHDWPMRNH